MSYKSTRIFLENKSKEFEKVGSYSHIKEYNNSAVNRYYYSMFIRVSYIYRNLKGHINTGESSHQSVIKQLKNHILDFVDKKEHLEKELKKKIEKVFSRLELCCKYRNTTDYKDSEMTINNVNYLYKTLRQFDSIYGEILEISGIIINERDDI